MKLTRGILDRLVSESGLHLRTYSPGDGITRYRFFVNEGNSYFGPDNGLYTALGLKEAETFLRGYMAGKPNTPA